MTTDLILKYRNGGGERKEGGGKEREKKRGEKRKGGEKKVSNVVDDRKDKEIEYLKNTIEHLNDVMYRASKHLLTAHQIIEEER